MRLRYDTHVHTLFSPCAQKVDENGQSLAAPER